MTQEELKEYLKKSGINPIDENKPGGTFAIYKPRKKDNTYQPSFFPKGANGMNSRWSNADYIIVEIPNDYHQIDNNSIIGEWQSFRNELVKQKIILFDTNQECHVYDKSASFLGKITDVLPLSTSSGSKSLPIQVLFFGAPGTGKSHAIDENPLIKAVPTKNKVRTVFHPESDYASFVGCYKPVMKKPLSAGKNHLVGRPVNNCELANEDTPDGNANHYLPLYLFSHDDCLNLEDDIKTRREEITYKFTPQAFTNAYVQAWKEYFSTPGTLPNNVYLIIEEINRGNCAQIFGNLFQLLDRDSENFSKYAIDTEYDLSKFLNEEMKDNSGNKLIDIFSSNPEFTAWSTNNDKESIVKGETLCLPPNLYIVASMNTSDQGLFPMDSAFKRRWQWKYIPIKNEDKGHIIVLNQIANVSTNLKTPSAGSTLPLKYDWWSFLEIVNLKIEDVNSSSDKKLGYWFVKPTIKGSTEIDIETFTCKVISYLWNDVFKNVPEGELNIFTFEYHGSDDDLRTKRDTHPFDTFFDPSTGLIDTQMVKDFLEQNKLKVKQINNTAGAQNNSADSPTTDAEQTENSGIEQESSDTEEIEEVVEGTGEQI